MQYLPSGYDSRPVAKNPLEGEPFQYYKNNIPTANNSASDYRKMIPMGQSSANYFWLRSAYYSNVNAELAGYSDGSLSGYDAASNNSRFGAACAIIH